MAENSNPQVVAFANEQIRPLANRLYQAYYAAKQAIANYNAADIGTKIEAVGAGELIADGSATDGRTRITGGDIYNMLTALGEFVDYYEGGAVTQADRTSVITKPHVHS